MLRANTLKTNRHMFKSDLHKIDHLSDQYGTCLLNCCLHSQLQLPCQGNIMLAICGLVYWTELRSKMKRQFIVLYLQQ